ncbi:MULTISPECIES: hypothetical protein [unclassified Sulfitobacter]|uniref:hypothetical protein n=1 Tax=unclassified Sulfitobacter TaxID=196795 RepID=UPI0023E12B4E|nr:MULTISPECIES: hypothetical protein [unclassified Sulfitobacter]MDF3349272.1 hypothetical protein [Sulfitobacter sp. KE12]MDF3371272.1 hypothetical protein [Sulfitobacter sp. KS8]
MLKGFGVRLVYLFSILIASHIVGAIYLLCGPEGLGEIGNSINVQLTALFGNCSEDTAAC